MAKIKCNMQDVKSSNVAQVGNSLQHDLLFVRYVGGDLYAYRVKHPEDIFRRLIAAESIGSVIRKEVAGLQYVKVTDVALLEEIVTPAGLLFALSEVEDSGIKQKLVEEYAETIKTKVNKEHAELFESIRFVGNLVNGASDPVVLQRTLRLHFGIEKKMEENGNTVQP